MADTVTVKLIGKAEIQRRIGGMELALKTRVKEILLDSAMAVQKGAKQRCPVNKKKGLGGRLRGSIMTKFYNNGLTAEIGTNVAYAHFVEFGTGVRGASSDHPPLPDGYVHGSKAGMPAQPYLYPALEEERPNFMVRLRGLSRGL